MNFDSLTRWIFPIVIAAAVSGNLQSLQAQIRKAQLKLIKASQTEAWGSPRFFVGRLAKQRLTTINSPGHKSPEDQAKASK